MPTNLTNQQSLRNIVLVGFMGSGKTTLGKILTKKLHYPLLDTDQMIEETASMNVSEIFSTTGENSFRDQETQLLKDLLEKGCSRHIISTGGGMVIREENRKLLQKLGFVVWLSCSPEETHERTSRVNTRPLLQCEDPLAVIKSMLEERSPMYEKTAHLKISTSGLDFEEISCGILESARYHFSTIKENSE